MKVQSALNKEREFRDVKTYVLDGNLKYFEFYLGGKLVTMWI